MATSTAFCPEKASGACAWCSMACCGGVAHPMWCCVRSCSLSRYASSTARTCSWKACTARRQHPITLSTSGHTSQRCGSTALRSPHQRRAHTAENAKPCTGSGLWWCHLGGLVGGSLHDGLRLCVVVRDVYRPPHWQRLHLHRQRCRRRCLVGAYEHTLSAAPLQAGMHL